MNERKSLDSERAHLKLKFQVGHENHLVLDLSYLRRGWSSFTIFRLSSPKNSKNPTRKFGIYLLLIFAFSPRYFSLSLFQIFLQEIFRPSRQTLNLAGRTVKYAVKRVQSSTDFGSISKESLSITHNG